MLVNPLYLVLMFVLVAQAFRGSGGRDRAQALAAQAGGSPWLWLADTPTSAILAASALCGLTQASAAGVPPARALLLVGWAISAIAGAAVLRELLARRRLHPYLCAVCLGCVLSLAVGHVAGSLALGLLLLLLEGYEWELYQAWVPASPHALMGTGVGERLSTQGGVGGEQLGPLSAELVRRLSAPSALRARFVACGGAMTGSAFMATYWAVLSLRPASVGSDDPAWMVITGTLWLLTLAAIVRGWVVTPAWLAPLQRRLGRLTLCRGCGTDGEA